MTRRLVSEARVSGERPESSADVGSAAHVRLATSGLPDASHFHLKLNRMTKILLSKLQVQWSECFHVQNRKH